MIPQRNVSTLANRLFVENGRKRRIPEDVIERDYCLAWLLCGLSQHPLSDVLAFKGGTCLRRCHIEDYRFSEDLDFTLVHPLELGDILGQLDEVFESVRRESNVVFSFDSMDRYEHEKTHTFYLSYTGPLPRPNTVKVDITKSERIVLELERRRVLRTYEEFSDLPEGREVLSYSIQEILIEKCLAVTDRARNQPRDLYDLAHIVDNDLAGDPIRLADPLQQKLESREGRAKDVLSEQLKAKEAKLRQAWDRYLSKQVIDLPGFDDSFRIARRTLAQFDEWRGVS